MPKPSSKTPSPLIARTNALVERFEAEGADAMLITALPNIRYLAGFSGSSGLLLVRREGTVLFTDPRYELQAPKQSPWKVKIATGSLIKEVAAYLKRKKVKRLAMERNRISFELVETLQAGLAKTGLLPLTNAVEDLRMVKSAEEIALIKTSVQTNSRALEEALKRFRPGMRESEFGAEIDYCQRQAGAEGPAFETIVASGERSAFPHARPTNTAIAARGILLIDMGCFQDAYASDMTRTFFVGKAPAKFKTMYRAVLDAQLAALEAIRGGVTAGEVDSAARKTLKKAGLGKAFVHSTGHGLGLEIHEPPRVGKNADGQLQPGFAITVEPGVYVEGFGGIRIEDTVIVTETGCEVLTPTSKDLLEL